MQTSTSLSSIASSTSSHSSSYGSRTILNIEELQTAAPRCRSSIVSCVNNDQDLFSSTVNNRSTFKCRQPIQSYLSSSYSDGIDHRQEYFARLCQHHRLLFVLNDYECQCGCCFSMEQGSYVVLYESTDNLSSKNRNLVTVISSDLICSKVPRKYLCDIDSLRQRVRCRRVHFDSQQSFDL